MCSFCFFMNFNLEISPRFMTQRVDKKKAAKLAEERDALRRINPTDPNITTLTNKYRSAQPIKLLVLTEHCPVLNLHVKSI